MADTRPDIKLEAGVQVDIYAALNAQTGFPAVTVGTQISVQNKGGTRIELTSKATTPVAGDGSNALAIGNATFANETGDLGAFALSPIVDSIINVEVV